MSKKFRIMDPAESREIITNHKRSESDVGKQTFRISKAALNSPATLPYSGTDGTKASTSKYILSTEVFSDEPRLIARRTVEQSRQTPPADQGAKKYRILTTEERQLIASIPKRASSTRLSATSARTTSQYKSGYNIIGNIETLATEHMQDATHGSRSVTQSGRGAGVIVEHQMPLDYHVERTPREPQQFRGLSIPYGSRANAQESDTAMEPVSQFCSVGNPVAAESSMLHQTSHLYRQTSTNRALGDATATYTHINGSTNDTILAKRAQQSNDYALSFQRTKHSVSTQRSASTKARTEGAASTITATVSGGAAALDLVGAPSTAASVGYNETKSRSGSTRSKVIAPISLTGSITLGDGAIASSTLATSIHGNIPEPDEAPITTISYQTRLQNPYAPQQRVDNQAGELLNMANGTVIAAFTDNGECLDNFRAGTAESLFEKKRCLPTYDYIELLKTQRTLEFVPSPPESPKPGEANPREVTDIIYTGPSLYSQYLASQAGGGGTKAGTKEKCLLQNIKVQANVLRHLKKKNMDIRQNKSELITSLNFFNG